MIDPRLLADHNLTAGEYDRIVELIGREPNLTELGIFSTMWSEHCSYKSSRVHLRRLPTPLEKYVALEGLHNRNETLFFRTIVDHPDDEADVAAAGAAEHGHAAQHRLRDRKPPGHVGFGRLEAAGKEGAAVLIGHVWSGETAEVLRKSFPGAREAG